MGIFNIDGKFFRALTKAGDFFLLGFFGLIFSLPVITIGASITAVFYVALKEVRDEEGYVFRGFLKSWKQNLVQSIVIELILAALAGFLYMDFRIFYQMANENGSTAGRLLMFVIMGLMVLLAAVALYVFPVLAKFDNTVLATFKNSLLLCMHHLPQTIAMLVATYVLIYFSAQFFTAFIVTIPLIYYIDAYILSRIFQQYVKKDDDSEGKDESTTKEEE